MRWDATMTEEEIAAALARVAAETWGPERVRAMRRVLTQAARALWNVFREPLTPLDDEPDLPAVDIQGGRRG